MLVSLLVLSLLASPPASAEDATVDQLLKKLPPPEKFVKSPTDRLVLDARTLNNDRAVKQLVEAIRFRDFKRALDLARELARRYPNNPVAHSVHGAIAYGLRQFAEAAEACHRAITLRPNYADPHLGLGFIELAQNRPGAAIPHLEKFAELEPKQPAAWMLLSACHERLGEKQKAVEEARRATDVSPASAGSWVQLARTEKAAGNTSATLRAILRAADLLPDSAYMMATVGYGYINLNQIPQAIPPLQRAAHFAPNDFLVQSQLGFCLEATGQTDAAIEHLRKGAKLAPTYAPVWEHLGLAYAAKGRHREAVESFERATKIMPNYKQAWQHLAAEYRLVGRPDDSQKAAARAGQLKVASPNETKRKG
jgi:tetratricopeptide (TPR) repeat protein